MSPSVDASAQWTSSRTTRSGRSELTPTSRSVTAVCSRCRSASASAGGGGGQVADTCREPREETRQLAATLGEVRAQRVRIGMAHEMLERRRERPVRRADDGVAVAVEHRCALGRNLAGELAHEPALAGAGLAGEKRRATPFPGGTG